MNSGRRLGRSTGGNIAIYSVLVLFGVFMVLPLVYALSNAFKPLDEMFVFPPRFFVRNPTMDNFLDLITVMSESWVPFSRYLLNTVTITVVGTAGCVIVTSMAAFVLSKYKFPGRKLIFKIVVISLMFSGNVTQIPSYLIMARLGWIDSLLSVVIPAMAMPMGLFLIKQYIEGIPNVLIEAATIDGANLFQIYWKIIKGLGGSTAFAYTFVGNYSDADVYVMSPASLKGQNLISDWTKGEMLWFWVNGTELLQNVRLEITINGKYMPIGPTYYTIDKEGQCVPVGTIPEGWGTTTTRGRIRLVMGWEGWIGLPIEETYGEIKNLTSIQIIVGNSTIKSGNILYLDEFWLTEMGEVPPLSKEELTYSALDALLESLTLGQIWDLETPEVGAQLGNIAATTAVTIPSPPLTPTRVCPAARLGVTSWSR